MNSTQKKVINLMPDGERKTEEIKELNKKTTCSTNRT